MRVAILVGLLMAAPALAEDGQADRSVRTVLTPPADVPVTVTAGDPILVSERVPVATTHNISLPRSVTLGNFVKGVVTIGVSDPITEVAGQKETIACASLNSLFGYRSHPCLIDTDNDGLFDQYQFELGGPRAALKTPIAYHRASATSSGGPVFRSELTYLGSDGASLHLGYREFVNDLARPAFSDTLQLPLTKTFPQEIRVKGIVFRIDRIDGAGLQYELLGPVKP